MKRVLILCILAAALGCGSNDARGGGGAAAPAGGPPPMTPPSIGSEGKRPPNAPGGTTTG